MTDLLTDLGKVAGVLAFLGYIPYLMSIVKRKTLPNPATWWIWSIMGGILLASYYVAGNREAIWVPLSYFIGPTVTAILSVKYGRNEFGSFERYCLGGAAVSLLLWWISGPIVALTMLIMIDLIAIAPTLRKTYFKPDSEDPLAWSVFWIANTINLYVVLASESPTYGTIAYPFELFLLPTSIMSLVIRGKVLGIARNSPKRLRDAYVSGANTSATSAATDFSIQTATTAAGHTNLYSQGVEFQLPDIGENFNEDLTTVVRQSARKIIAKTVAAELNDLMSRYSEQQRTENATSDQTPLSLLNIDDSPLSVAEHPKAANRSDRSSLPSLPDHLKHHHSVEEALIWLRLNGIPMERLGEQLPEVLEAETTELSPLKIEQLQVKWQEEYQAWNQRSFVNKRYVYLWLDSVCINENTRSGQHILFATGLSADGYRETLGMSLSEPSVAGWKSLLLGIKNQGLQHGIQLAVGSGKSEAWNALSQVFPDTKQQHCWDSKTADVLKQLPKKLRVKAKEELWEIYRAETEEDATQGLDDFVQAYQVKYYEAAECLTSDRDRLLTFYNFPAEHWRYLYSNKLTALYFKDTLIVNNTAVKLTDELSVLPLVLQLVKKAQKQWPRIKGFKHIGEVIEGTSFNNGISTKSDADSLVDSLSTS